MGRLTSVTVGKAAKRGGLQLVLAFFFFGAALSRAQLISATSSMYEASAHTGNPQDSPPSAGSPPQCVGLVERAFCQHHPWEYGPIANVGVGTGDNSAFKFFSAGATAGKTLTDPALPGVFRGQFEYAAEVLPFWQSYTPRVTYTVNSAGHILSFRSGGTYTGIALTPIILRWDLIHSQRRILPWVQGAGGLVYTTHKYPYPGTSVWNFEPQFGVGMHIFVRDRRSISIAANAVHISSASLGDKNPGVNALVQFQIGYTWWK